MGREVKRVAENFSHPVGETWPGYLADDEYDPPAGDGYQLWETVSEGSPVTPVFEKPEELIDFLARSKGYSRRAAEAFVTEGGFVPSAVMTGDGVWHKDIETAVLK